jgi:hypothetical protein
VHPYFKKLSSYREQTDEIILEWSKELSEADLDHALE